MYKYSYKMTDPNLTQLYWEVCSSSIGHLYFEMRTKGDDVNFHFSQELTTSEKETLGEVIGSHIPEDSSSPRRKLKRKIMVAQEFGRELIAEFATENVLMGLSSEQMKKLANDFAPIMNLLISGSLKLAKSEWSRVEPIPDVLTQERIDKYLKRIDNLLLQL